MRPYLGVSCLVLSARKSAFSAPRICTVEAGALARFIKEPAGGEGGGKVVVGRFKPRTEPTVRCGWQPPLGHK